MKYPQLVSTRAVNAISDWLVSRLEQLGVEAPLIYSRLLLSLLNSSVQINDPIEFSNLESYLANRKGSKRIPRCDADTLKKIAAVQCLMDTVSSEQEIAKVENLVDELCDKLSEIEKQSNEEELPPESPTLKNIETEDPRKRYYRAFPALSKEMEDTVWLHKRNAKSLTWPTGNAVSSNPNVNALNNTAGVKRKQKRRRNQGVSRGKSTNARKNSFDGHVSPTWDTDFEGSWEMGRDLIKEFIVMQNNRNRSTSESDACNLRNDENMEKRMKPMFTDDDEEFYGASQNNKCGMKNEVADNSLDDDISAYSDILQSEISITHNALTSDEGYSTHEALTSLSEVDASLSTARRLYERDVSNDSLNLCSSEQSDFAQFKAKFNSSVEALWKNNNKNNNNNNNDVTSLPSNHKNLENFWTNYYNHHYDVDKFNEKDQISDNLNDFFSMPTNLGKNEKSIKLNARKMIGDNYAPSGGVFLQDSIWSDNTTKNYEEDDSFYANVLKSSYKNDSKIENNFYDIKDSSYSFNISKWSECSFETPFVPSSSASSSNGPSVGLTKNDLRENMLKNSYLYNYRQPVAPTSNISLKNNTIPCTPTSLPDIYGSLNMGEKNSDKQPITSQSSVTLLNHSCTSGFVEYSRIKSIYKYETNTKMDAIDDYHTNRSVVQTPYAEDENLLTSGRTHFRPIKHSYADGHQFDISNNFDEIKFERSESGFLYFESERYLEYTRFDTFLSDDEPNYSNMVDNSKRRKNEFALKFRIKQIDKNSQTDPFFNDGYILRAHIRNINCRVGDESSDNDSIMGENCLKNETRLIMGQWSMAEIEKRCVDNNNTHTLWGLCPACNNDNKSIPANRLLKDELNIEGDEIMSDLKYMQDLYIGSDWEDDDTDCDAETIKDCELYQSLDPMDGDEEQEQIFYNVTKFISDLLKPENAKSLANALSANKNIRVCTDSENNKNNSKLPIEDEENSNNNNNNNNSNEKYVGGLWSYDENIIWKKELKPINDNLLSHLNNNKTSSFLEKLNWEYSNLADIWKTASQNDKDIKQSSPIDYANIKHIDHQTHCSEISTKNLKNLISFNISQQNKKYENDNNHVHSFGNNNNNNINNNKVANRFDRKRRHSASQNVNKIYGSNDFCDNMIIGNKIEVMATREMDYSKLTSINDSPATIITCKYWTTLDTTSASPFFTDKSSNYDGISALAMNPSSILKHVAVVSRPLTR